MLIYFARSLTIVKRKIIVQEYTGKVARVLILGTLIKPCSRCQWLFPEGLRLKVTIHQVNTMLATSKTVLFAGYNHLLTIGTDDPSLAGARAIISVGSSVPVVSRWLWSGNRTFSEVSSMVVTWWKVAFGWNQDCQITADRAVFYSFYIIIEKINVQTSL